MATTHDPEIDRILLQSRDPSLRILGYGLVQTEFSYDQLMDGARLNGENPVDDTLHALERSGHIERNGNGTYHLPRRRFSTPYDALEVLHERVDGSMDVYHHVCSSLDESGDAAVPSAYLDERFPDEDWRLELSPFVMSGALRRCNYYDWDELPRLVPGEAAEYVEDEELPVQVYEFGDPVYRRAADEVVDFNLREEEEREPALEARTTA